MPKTKECKKCEEVTISRVRLTYIILSYIKDDYLTPVEMAEKIADGIMKKKADPDRDKI
jgi:hypothetical protein